MKKCKAARRPWLQEHLSDHYVKLARQQGYRSRACYKLLELQQRYQLIKPGMTVLDLGAAPGGWSQLAAQWVEPGGRVVASDILPMDSLAGVTFIQGDFTDDTVYQRLLAELNQGSVDLVMSDMAPNISGIKVVDQAKSIALVELAFDLAQQLLGPQGQFLTKVFQGEGFDQLLRTMRAYFTKVKSCKPKASRPRSRELYLLASR